MGPKIYSEMQGSFDQHSDMETKLTQDFYKQLNFTNSSREFHQEEVEKGTTENEEEEFSFTCGGADASPIAAEDAFINGRIKPIFPLFDPRDFDESDASHENLPMKPPVKKFFVETKDSVVLTSANAGDDTTVGAFRDRPDRKAVEVSPEVCKKSNSTGFSKIWRFKDFLGRSNSDGRDAFVFLNENSHARDKVERKLVPANKVKKGKTASLSAHEAYLRSKAKDGEKRRSYLPYRPELMGFFTNVNSGLSKNVHPY